MGKIKQVVLGDIEQEEKARKKAGVKREQKKLAKKEEPKKEETKEEIKAEKKTKKEVSETTRGKKYLTVVKLVDKKKIYPLSEGLELVKKTSISKFDGTVEAHFNVVEKGLRASVALPHGTGKQIRVKVCTDELISAVEKDGRIDFDILVAHPSMMPKLAKIAKILGPKGLMPNPKTNTIGEDPSKLVEILSKGQVNLKTEADFPIIHTVIGKVSFETKKLEENFAAIVKGLGKDKIVSVFLKPTMGPSVRVSV